MQLFQSCFPCSVLNQFGIISVILQYGIENPASHVQGIFGSLRAFHFKHLDPEGIPLSNTQRDLLWESSNEKQGFTRYCEDNSFLLLIL